MNDYQRGLLKTVDSVQCWQVSVEANGENILTIGDNHLSGIENVSDYAELVENCALHLLAFIGKPSAIRAQVSEEECCEWEPFQFQHYRAANCNNAISHVVVLEAQERCLQCGRKIRIKGE